MGQQQLMIILLVALIIAVATVVAINTMLESRMESNYDGIRQKMMEASTLAQAYYQKNEMMGGGGKSYQNITLQDMNIEANDTELGAFSLESGDQSFRIIAEPISGGNNIVGVIYSDRIEFVNEEESED